MLSQSQRATILELHAKGMNKREIAKLLNLSRQSVRKVLQANSTAMPKIEREEKAAPYRQQILELLHTCKGNLVRVHEELVGRWRGAVVSGVDGVLPQTRHRTNAHRAHRPLSLRARRRDAARHLAA